MDENKQDNKLNKKINKDTLKWIIVGFIGFAVIVLIFASGVFVGGMKAKFSYRWAENYHKNFGGPRNGFMEIMPFLPGDFIEGHGTFGEIIKINDSDLVIRGREDMEKVINITKDTIIKNGRETIKKENLKVGSQIVVIGSPNEQGQIEAELIRFFDNEDGMAPSFKRMLDAPPLSRR